MYRLRSIARYKKVESCETCKWTPSEVECIALTVRASRSAAFWSSRGLKSASVGFILLTYDSSSFNDNGNATIEELLPPSNERQMLSHQSHIAASPQHSLYRNKGTLTAKSIHGRSKHPPLSHLSHASPGVIPYKYTLNSRS